jgi:hypothetical protein
MSQTNRNVTLESNSGTCLAYSSFSSRWYIGNSVGEVDPLFVTGESIPISNCERIQSLSINSQGTLIAICQEKSVSLYDEKWEEKNPILCRTTLPITHSEYDPTGQHL